MCVFRGKKMFNYERLITLKDGRVVKLKYLSSLLNYTHYSQEFLDICKNGNIDMLSMRIYNSSQILIETLENERVGACWFHLSEEDDSCELYGIEIYDEAFIDCGIGTLMITEMEKIAESENKSLINGHYRPYGRFSGYSKDFYLRNGYKISFDKKLKRQVLEKHIGKSTAEEEKDLSNPNKPSQRGE